MERRIHEVMDGERGVSELTGQERARLRGYRKIVERELDALAEEPCPDLAPAVMARIAELETSRATRPRRTAEGSGSAARTAPARRPGPLLGWLWRPRTVSLSLRPAWVLAAGAAAVLVIGGGPWTGPGTPRGAPAGAGSVTPAVSAPAIGASPTVMVQFRLEAPGARGVRLAGDFTGWAPLHTMFEQAPGVWSVTVPLPPGVHDYGFVVDGEEWRTDPLAPQVADGFGGTNSRMAVLLPEPAERS